MPKEQRQKIKDEQFMWGVLKQSNISPGNIKVLDEISMRYDGTKLGRQATALIQVGRVKPGRKKRIAILYSKHRDLFNELVESGLIWDDITPRIQAELESEIQEYEAYEFDAQEHIALMDECEEHHHGKLIKGKRPEMSAVQMMVSTFSDDDADNFF